ncbi:MAG: hypothetical protein RBR68_12345 [Tenuifilaceae bacterium]|jgi:hypothetical protein|nr:hypothetical protein [Tenuifilaceae bacterium]
MKKLLLGAAVLLFAQFSFGQAVNDNAIIPVSVTLNSILRLTVVTGGNIEFVVNTIDDYTNGINSGGADTRYQTVFTVSSSRDFDVTLRSEEDNLLGQDNTANVLTGDNVGYDLTGGTGGNGTNWNLPVQVEGLSATAATIVDGITGFAAGDAVQNRFVIQWRLGTSEGGMNTANLLTQSIPADRYVTNVFLELTGK